MAVLAASFGTSAANIALPAVTTSFDASPSEAQWVVVAYLLGMTAASVMVGALGDRWGRRRALSAGLAVFLLAAAVSAAAPTLLILVLARAVQGVAAAVMTALPLALARDVTSREQTGRVVGLLGTTSAVGTALGPAVGGALVQWGGWAVPFWAMVPFGALALVLHAWRGRRGPDAPARPAGRFDVIGATLLSAAIATYTLAFTTVTPGGSALPLLGVAAALLVATVAVERRSPAPVLPLPELRSNTVVAGVMGNLLVAAVMMTTLIVGPFALHDGLDLPVAGAGLVMAVGPVMSAISGVIAGRLVGRASPRALSATGLVAVTTGATALAVLPGVWGAPGYVVALLILTPGYQLFLAAANTRVLSDADPDRRGTVAGVLALARNVGLVTGASAMGALFVALQGAETGPSAVLSAARGSFLVAAALAAVALVAFLILTVREPRPRPRRAPAGGPTREGSQRPGRTSPVS